jgi:quinol monooxygenase YgiN
MAFVQIIEYRSSRFDEMEKLDAEWEAAAGDDSTVRRVVVARDREDPDRYVTMAFFDSYESAMENSNLPVTQEFSQRMMALADGPPTFRNLDIVRDAD